MAVILETLKYLSELPSFYAGLGFMTAMSMFIGAVLHNGDIPQAKKSLVGVMAYFLILLWMGIDRMSNAIKTGIFYDEPRVYAPTITLVLVTICYVVGVFLGVWIVQLKKKK